mmetsp:Transcript_92546/g.160408  ORF Transcript_92546/g.160408 Transcript_92546/m.160408 type:complete len:524 (-) Transcript_92546:398-1969(-)
MWQKIDKFRTNGCHPSARRAHSASVVGQWMLVFGGRGRDLNCPDVNILDFETMEWEVLQGDPASPSLRWNHTASVIGRKIYIFGGENEDLLHNDTYILDVDTLRWRHADTSGTTPCPRYAHTSCVYGNKIVVFGGSSTQHLSDVHVLDTETLTWTRPTCTGPGPKQRCGHAAACLGHHMYIFGGLSTNFLNDLWELDLETFTWRELGTSKVPLTEGAAPTVRGHFTASAIDNHIIFFGGWNGSIHMPQLMNDVHVFTVEHEPFSIRWRTPYLDGTPPPARNTHTASVLGDKVYIFGGWDRKTCFQDLYCLDFATVIQHFGIQKLCQSWEGTLEPKEVGQYLPQFMKKFIQTQAALLNQKEYSDVVFDLGGQLIYAHKCILATHCDFFNTLFQSGMQDASANTIIVGAICGDHRPSYEAFYVFLSFIYCGRPSATLATACELICLADYYRELWLYQWGLSFFRRTMTVETVAEMMVSADKYNLQGLVSECIQYIVKQYRAVQPTLKGLPVELKDGIMEALALTL